MHFFSQINLRYNQIKQHLFNYLFLSLTDWNQHSKIYDDAFKYRCLFLRHGSYSFMQAATLLLLSLSIYYLAFINIIIISHNYNKITFFFKD